MTDWRDGCRCAQCVALRNAGVSIRRFIERLAAEDAMKDSDSALRLDAEVRGARLGDRPTEEAKAPKTGPDSLYGNAFARMLADDFAKQPMASAKAVDELFIENDKLRAEIVRLCASLKAEQTMCGRPDTRTVRRCAEVLATFYRAPLSMSSVQPLLTLAEELNPSLKGRK